MLKTLAQPTTLPQDVLSVSLWLGQEIYTEISRAQVATSQDDQTVLWVGMEKQLSVGGHSSALMFHMQMVIAEAVHSVSRWWKETHWVLPLPVQLNSYMKKRGVDTTSGRTIVASKQIQALNLEGRVSQHAADAYFLARLAEEVSAGQFTYKLPTKELELFPWTVVNKWPM